jgi:hypothetical protein
MVVLFTTSRTTAIAALGLRLGAELGAASGGQGVAINLSDVDIEVVSF